MVELTVECGDRYPPFTVEATSRAGTPCASSSAGESRDSVDHCRGATCQT